MTKKRQSLTIESEEVIVNVVKDLVKKRGIVKSKFSLFVKYVTSLGNNDINSAQRTELQFRLQKAETLLASFSEIQDEIDLNVSDSQLEIELEERESFENRYYSTMASSKCLLNQDDSSIKESTSKNINSIKLPTIKLPSFDGSYDQWLEFKDTYLSLIHSSKDIDEIQKFHYLRSALTGNALQVIKSLEFTAGNYRIAWELLENRFNNNRLLIYNHLKALFAMQPMSKESSAQIRKLTDNILRNLRALKMIGEPTDSWDSIVIFFAASKLDAATEREWENFQSNSINNELKIKLEDFLKFLKNRADMLEMVKLSSNKAVADNPKKALSNQVNNSTHSYTATQTNINKGLNNKASKSSKRQRICIMCDSNHSLYSCNKFLQLSVGEKSKFIDEKKLCRNCLRVGHTEKNCWFGPCKQCNLKHNSLLHCDGNASNESLQATPRYEPVADNSQTALLHSVAHAINKQENTSCLSLTVQPVLLSTALVEIADSNNKYHTIRALLDSGSQQCFIAESLCKRLHTKMLQSTVQVTGVGHCITQSTQSCEVQLRSKTCDYNKNIKCLVLPHITAQLPSLNLNINFNIPDNVTLADPNFYSPNEIQLLIGADLFWELLNEGLIRLPTGPCLQNTKLGWIISGPIQTKNLRINQIHCNFTQTLDVQLKRFWEIEEITTTVNNNYSKDERACETLFSSTTLRDDKGRFSVRIPLNESADSLGDTFTLAENRFRSLERKLARAPEYKKMYAAFLQEYIDLGQMSRISSYSSPTYFLPHHGVFRENSSTTKLRVVFDASAKSTSGKSLNDIQLTGPILQNDIFSILLRFRRHKYIACADVEKMFRQVLIQPDQRNLQCILWRENPSDPLGIYQLNTVTYGTASAPYLSMRCIRQLAEECNDDVISRVIKEDIYVDDLITGHDDKNTLKNICDGVFKTLSSGCFILRKWIFNYDASNTNTANSSSKELSLGENCQNKTLGLGWFNASDDLHFITKLENEGTCTTITKRNILSVVSQIYDPLGLLAPTIIIAKVMLQKLWLCKIGWDDPIPRDIETNWKQFTANLNSLRTIRVPRYVLSDKGDDNIQIELHIFCDASQSAYGACAHYGTCIHSLY
ncbi:hypothetical protein PYW07_014489 [Mythimna separata]|uniref:DUF1758 domain-containing protein n=1 Tax=Mythimna separata TaxID=271217 RepID=A0AAD7Z018_MYTSE|nr:hypothetical protein PYW07_014489 [Mythimna separata]